MTNNHGLAGVDMEPEEAKLLRFLYAMYGRRTKPMIRDAWETGDYTKFVSLRDNDVADLQFMRNSRGPTWLWRAKLSKI